MLQKTGNFHMRTDQEFRQALEVLSAKRRLRSSDIIRQLVFAAYDKLDQSEKQV